MIEITLIDTADQKYDIQIGDIAAELRFRYNVLAERWAFDLLIDAVPVLQGRMVVTGRDLLNIPRLGLGMMFACDVSGGDTAPDYDGLVSGKVRLYYLTPADVVEARAAL